MFASLHAHYLEIEWQEAGCARTVKVSPEPIEICELDGGVLCAETQVFHDLCPWVGLRLEGELTGITPAFERADGVLMPMLRLEDGHGEHWWVQDNGWDPVGNRHLSELHRSMGQFNVVLGPHRLLLNNVIDGLSRVQVEEYLHDFQHDLVWLVMGFGGATGSASSGFQMNRELIEALEAFAAAARQVLVRPANSVCEVQVEKIPARVRPNSATFRQYLRNPVAHRLPSRGVQETPDIADNRYLRHLVQVCEKLCSSLTKAVGQQAIRLADRARLEAERAAVYNKMTHRQVDPEIFDRQLAELKKKLSQVEAYCDVVPASDERLRTLEFQVGAAYAKCTDKFFYNNRDGSVAAGESKEWQYEFSTLQIPQTLADVIKPTLSFCDYYRMVGTGGARLEFTNNGKPYRAVHFTGVSSIKPFTKALARKFDKRAQLEANNWLAPLTVKERQESQQEAHTAHLRGQTYRQYAQKAEQISSALNMCQKELRAQDLHWQRLEVVPSVTLPMGVRFSQSPSYAACKVAFSKLTQLVQQGGLKLDSLEALDRISVLHASALYERWCLVKILSILIEDYHFQPEAGWQEELIRAVSGKPETLELILQRKDVGMSASLEIQPVLPNGRRPDFRLRFFYDDKPSAPDLRDKERRREKQPSAPPFRKEGLGGLVLDAKFRTSWRRGELGRMLASLVEEKDYGQQGDRVFILHPAPKAILKPTSPLSWGKDCDYGQEAGNGHSKGVVYLAPGVGASNPELNLRRLLILQLQASFPTPSEVNLDGGSIWKSKSFCIRCGKAHQPCDVQHQSTRRGSSFWILSCNECQMHTIRTHCYGCNSSLIFKNGLNLTYHRTVADQITNVVCPQCGKYFDNDLHGREQGTGMQDGDI
ncbi:hypothetical protein [Duganella fentianensis]|uniref:hypothetical protein n=1 Tax=Duganella fentianensis TaxID=2692177 RepID=UPI0032B233E4